MSTAILSRWENLSDHEPMKPRGFRHMKIRRGRARRRTARTEK